MYQIHDDNPIYTSLKIEGNFVICELDSGSERTVIKQCTVQKILSQVKLQRLEPLQKLTVVIQYHVTVSNGPVLRSNLEFTVVEDELPNVVGRNRLRVLRILKDCDRSFFSLTYTYIYINSKV